MADVNINFWIFFQWGNQFFSNCLVFNIFCHAYETPYFTKNDTNIYTGEMLL